MSSSFPPVLPPDVLDLIVDHLRYEQATLKACCLVSKPWVPRARRQFFFQVDLWAEFCIKSWMKAFPDPSTSPARYTRVLRLTSLQVFTAATTYARDCVESFSHIVELIIAHVTLHPGLSLVPFHGLWPTLKSFALQISSIPPQEFLDFICSFPLLEDLSFQPPLRSGVTTDGWDAPPNPPRLTGSLHLVGNIRSTVHVLLGLPNGLRFSKITMNCSAEDAGMTSALVSECSDTLESLSIGYLSSGTVSFLIDLSKVTKLKDVEFALQWWDVQWVTSTLRTAKPETLRNITVSVPAIFTEEISEAVQQEWRELNGLLTQLWTSHSVRSEIDLTRWRGRKERSWAERITRGQI